MSKSKHLIVQELDPASVEGVSELQRKHYLTLGYTPYLMGDGRKKWLTDAQRVYLETKVRHRPVRPKEKPEQRGTGRRKRRRRNRVVLFIRDNWLILLLLAIILATIIYMLK
ncbi:MAG: hypothetical protein K0B87_04240 [Candidatus Syntrophosphaera sp.]|nr:hypothetical protein [Candidatus Syntrophosphaera sp.]